MYGIRIFLSHLHGIGVIGGVLEETVVRVEDFPGDEEEELPTRPAVVEALLLVEGDVQARLRQLLLGGTHHLLERVLQQRLPPDLESNWEVSW